MRGACWEELLYQVLTIVGNAVPLVLLFTWVLEAAWESMSKTCLLSIRDSWICFYSILVHGWKLSHICVKL